MKAIIRKGNIENCVRQLSRHATPRPFTHLCLSGANGRQFASHVDYDSTDVFVFCLEDWDALPALVKTPEGDPLHMFMGLSDTTQNISDFADRDVIELYIAGHVQRFVNFKDSNGVGCVGLKINDSSFLDAIDPAFVPYRSDTMTWAECPDKYKDSQGRPLADPDDIQETALITPPPEKP